MANLTLRSIPESVLDKLRALAAAERRSLNGEILVLIEGGLERETTEAREDKSPMSTATQARLWEGLCGQWQDDSGSSANSRPRSTVRGDPSRTRTF